MNFRRRNAFTLIELLVVISIIVVLIGIAFPAFQGVQNAAKKTQAKNDLLQVATAVTAFYTEYGKYPIESTADTFFGSGTAPTGVTATATNDKLLDVLRNNTASTSTATAGGNLVTVLNPRGIVFISPPDAKTPATPKAGVGSAGTGAPTPLGQFYDPWGKPLCVLIDGNYDNVVANPYGSNGGAGSDPIRQGVIAWSLGKNGVLGGGGTTATGYSNESGTSGVYTSAGDVISWQ